MSYHLETPDIVATPLYDLRDIAFAFKKSDLPQRVFDQLAHTPAVPREPYRISGFLTVSNVLRQDRGTRRG